MAQGLIVRVVFLGNSLVWGGYGGNFVEEVARLAPEHDIINAGVGGNTVINLVNRVDGVLSTYEPDSIVVAVGGNDAISYTQPATRPYYQHTHHIPNGYVSPDTFEQHYRELLMRIQLGFAQAWVMLEPTEYNPAIVDTMKQYNDLARDVAQAMNVPVLDLMRHFPPNGLRDRPPLSLDTIHLIGKRVAENWTDYEAEKEREGYTFTFDGFHLMPHTAAQVAKLVIDFLEL
ncbi:MAG: hypothetical protein CUN54_07795 [Phototrophicales bacterium]|nr:MAG: hypothetical protein CUN54_07795 [Phototrophicales bacterium]